MRIKLLADYRGRLSGEQFYPAGEYDAPDQMPQEVAEGLVAHGRAELVEQAQPEPEPEPKPAAKPRTRSKRGGRTSTS